MYLVFIRSIMIVWEKAIVHQYKLIMAGKKPTIGSDRIGKNLRYLTNGSRRGIILVLFLRPGEIAME